MAIKLRGILSFCFLTLLLGGYFFNIKFELLSFGTFYPAIFFIIFLGSLNQINYKNNNGDLLFVVMPIYLAVIVAIISFVINSPDADYFLVGALFIMATVGLSSFGFFEAFSRMNSQVLLVAVIFVLVLNAILMILMFVSPQFQLAYQSILSDVSFQIFGGGESALESMYRFRMIGASGFASYSTGFTQCIGLFFLAVYYFITERKLDLIFLAVSVLLIISALLSARSSFLGILLWGIFCLIFFRWRFLSIFAGAFALVVILFMSLIALMDTDGAEFFSKWLFDLFVSGASSESLAESIQMLETPFWDAGVLGFSRWFGDLGYDYFRSADVGFIRLILAGGIGTLLLVVLHFILIGLFFFAGNSSVFFRVLYIFLMIYLFAIMFKGAIIFDFFAFDFLVLMLCWVSRKNKKLVA
ncbi:hypothetical protein [Polaromonas sp. CG_9.11]|uniref:hypothetical protein n=1 Tax=Polaromonas sp. CG_9.11 TaxID=2787730 RepID=UPI0018CA7812|nr:hypothetical protein [Polaromonas sp. CG_9.11]MBG6074696.1 hypothetical protein [Polaromonas sp. CG_9.11]